MPLDKLDIPYKIFSVPRIEILIPLFSFFFMTPGTAQNLKLVDLEYCKNHTLAESEVYLFKRGFDFSSKSKYLWDGLNKYNFIKVVKVGTGVIIGIIFDEKLKLLMELRAQLRTELTIVRLEPKL